jgi:hypothetical protein
MLLGMICALAAWLAVVVVFLAACRMAARGDSALAAAAAERSAGGRSDGPSGERPILRECPPAIARHQPGRRFGMAPVGNARLTVRGGG